MRRNYLITGARGMLGAALMRHLQSRGEAASGTDLPDADLTDPDAVERLFRQRAPTHVVNAAAYTDVNGAESHREVCRAANALAPRVVAEACARHGARLLHISTDYVFDGKADRPYREDAPTGPVSFYGLTKLEGEQAVMAALPEAQIARTAWLFGAGKRTFVSAILDALAKEGPVKVVEDEIGSPTYAADLARALAELSAIGASGVFHLVNAGRCSRFEMARAIAEFAGRDPGRVVPIRSAEWVSPAARPLWSVLDSSAAVSLGVAPLRPWRDAVREFVDIETASAAPERARLPLTENRTP